MATFYFDGHSGITDPDAAWIVEENGFNGEVLTYAACGTLGTETSNELRGGGTNAPDYSAQTITSVYVRVFATSNFGGVGDRTDIKIYTDGEAELLASLSYIDHTNYSTYTLLTTPSGGWTWASLRELELVAWVVVSGGEQRIHKLELEVNTENTGESIYFNCSDSGPSDPDSVWTNETNASDDATSTSATCSANGSTSSNFLLLSGTNAPAAGRSIISVKARSWGGGTFVTRSVAIYTDALGELLGTTAGGNGTYGNYIDLTAPAAGWTWATLQALECKAYFTTAPDGTGGTLAKVELYVITDPPAKGIYRLQGFQ
jgi:hypothetical protein